MKKPDHKKISIRNRRASYDHEILEKMVAGMILQGTEIKSIREGQATVTEAHCYFKGPELWVKNLHIKEFQYGGAYNHDPLRDRQLLVKKKEALKWKKRIDEKGLTIVPIKLFISSSGYAKLEIALGKGKKVHDKRESIKKKDSDRELSKAKLR
jgi:SsrA-binding protein